MTYAPRPGSAPEKLINYLATLEPGHMINSATASAIMCVSLKHMHQTIAPALANGALVKTVSEHGRIWLSLPEGGAVPMPAEPEVAPAADAEPTDEFDALLFLDGQLQIRGATINGDQVVLSTEQAGQLSRLLLGHPGASQ